MTTDRRSFLKRSAASALVVAATGVRAPAAAARVDGATPAPRAPLVPHAGRLHTTVDGYRPVITPNGATLPFRLVDGAKVFRLIAEEVEHEFVSGLSAHCWGYNGRVHGPTIEAVEGDHVRIYVTNRLPAPTTVHWHGVVVPNGMDGVGGLTQRAIEPGETFKYEFTLRHPGTFMYHSHHDEMTQMALGLMGLFVVHPRTPTEAPPDRDFAFMLSEWAMKPGVRRPDPNEMTDFNVLTLNARVFPGTAPLVVKRGDRVRIRIGNLSAMDHHPIHLHGHRFWVTETDGGSIPTTARQPEVSVLIPVGSTRTVEFVASEAGDWAIHCHMTHHAMTQMGHGIPNLVGVDPSAFDAAIAKVVPGFGMTAMPMGGAAGDDVPPNSVAMLGGDGPFGYITMGGMFTLLKVRDEVPADGDGGWYAHPAGTVVDVATAADLARDGIDPASKATDAPTTHHR